MAQLKSEPKANGTTRRTSSRLNAKKEIPETQQTSETQEETQISVDGGFASDQKENGAQSWGFNIAGGEALGFTSALMIHKLDQGKEQKEAQRHSTRSRAGDKNGITNGATTTKLSVAELPAWDAQIDREAYESVGWDHMEGIDGNEDGIGEGGRTPRIENLLPKNSIWDRDVLNDSEKEDLAPPSSHPRESSVMEYKARSSSYGEKDEFQNTEGQVISPDRGNQRWEASFPGIDYLHQEPFLSLPKSKYQFSQSPPPSIQSQSRSQQRRKDKQSDARSLLQIRQVSHNTEENTAQDNLNGPDGNENSPQYEWDASMTKEEFDETVKAAEIVEKEYGGTELQEYKSIEEAKSPQIKAVIQTLESHGSKASEIPRLNYEKRNPSHKQASMPIGQLPSDLQEQISQFVASHEFSKNVEKGTRLTTLRRRRFTRDLYDYCRALGLSSDQADFQIGLARADYRRRRGLETVDDMDTGTEFGEEIDDSKELITRAQKRSGLSSQDDEEVGAGLEGQEYVDSDGGIGKSTRVDGQDTKKFSGSRIAATPQRVSKNRSARKSQKSQLGLVGNSTLPDMKSTDSKDAAMKQAAEASVSRDSPRMKRKRDAEDDDEGRRSSVNPNGAGVIDKQARKIAKKQRRAAEKEAKKAARGVNGSSNASNIDGEAPLAAEKGETKGKRKAGKKHRKNATKESDNKTSVTTTLESDASKPFSKPKSAQEEAVIGESNPLSSTTAVTTIAGPFEAIPTPNRKRKRQEAEPINKNLLEGNSRSTTAAEPIKEDLPGKTESKKKKKRKSKGIDSENMNIGSDSTPGENCAREDVKVANRKAQEEGAPGSEEIGRIQDADSTMIELGKTMKRGRGSRGRKGKSQAMKALDQGMESIEGDQNSANERNGQTEGPTTLQPRNVKPLEIAPGRQAEDAGMHPITERNPKAESGEKRKRSRGPRARAANAGIGRGQSTENPFNSISADVEASKQQPKVGDKRKSSPEAETPSNGPVPKKARKKGQRRSLGTVDTVQDTEANHTPKNGNSSPVSSSRNENTVEATMNRSNRKARSHRSNNGHPDESKNKLKGAKAEGNAHHL